MYVPIQKKQFIIILYFETEKKGNRNFQDERLLHSVYLGRKYFVHLYTSVDVGTALGWTESLNVTDTRRVKINDMILQDHNTICDLYVKDCRRNGESWLHIICHRTKKESFKRKRIWWTKNLYTRNLRSKTEPTSDFNKKDWK